MAEKTNQRKALEEATVRAAEKLADVDLEARCKQLGIAPPESNGRLKVRVLGNDLVFTPPKFEACDANTGAPANPVDRILALQYLLCDTPVEATGDWATFREFPGGQFYWGPFHASSVAPLARRIGNDPGVLRERLDRFDWSPMDVGDLGARIKVMGKLEVGLVYHEGDDEFPSDINILFDACMKRVYVAEHIAALARRVCWSLNAK